VSGLDDILTHLHLNGDFQIDYGANGYGGTDWTRASSWCDTSSGTSAIYTRNTPLFFY
jgi:hypothetical protein